MIAWKKMFTPRRDWQGRDALVPVATCYQLLDLYSWSFALMGSLAISFLIMTSSGVVTNSSAFWIATSMTALQWIGIVFRGLPFLIRYIVFAGGLFVFIVCSVAVLGITPNWAFLVLMLLSSTVLFFGIRTGLLASAVLCTVHVVIAWGWVAKFLPPDGISLAAALEYTDFRSVRVWVRVLVISAGLIAAMQLLVSYVLRELNRALAESKSALERLAAEQELRARTERKFSAIFNDSPDICGVSRVSDGRILDVNRAFETLTGWTRAEAIGRTTLEIGSWVSAEERAQVMRTVQEKGVVSGHETTWLHRSGARHYGLMSIRLMEIDGDPVLNVVIRDTTDRRRRERALQTFSELTGGVTGQEFFAASVRHLALELGVRYALIVELTADLNFTPAGRTLAAWVNGPAPDFTYTLPGTPCENVVGQGLCHYPDRIAELFPTDAMLGELHARSYAGLPIRDHTGQTLGLVAVLDDKPMPDSEAAALMLVLVATRAAAEVQRVRNEREIIQLNADLENRVRQRTDELAARVAEVERLNAEQQALMRDLRSSQQSADRTAARLQESNSNLLAANQELEAFSYSVSHDLRAPLRNVTGFLELLGRRAKGQIDAESERFIDIVNTETLRMGLLIDDLLTFSRIGRTEIKVQTVDLAQLVADVREEFTADLGDRVIEWQVGPLPLVRGDPTLLRQVVANLLSNAIKFTRRCPAARIELGANSPMRGDNRTTIFVRDNGAGFNPAYLEKLFGVFQRLHNARDFEGTGIGLANVKRIITRHGGRVWAEGQVDRGATFYFTLSSAEP